MQAPTIIGETSFYTVKAYDVDDRKFAKPITLIQAMHEAAMQNVIRLGISVWDLEPQQLAWVLTNIYIHFERLPILGERIKIVTQPSGFERVFTYRDYKAYDENGTLIFYSASTWLLMNTATRRMERIPASILELAAHIPAPSECLPRCAIKFKGFKESHFKQNFRVDWHDLDFNGHANNVQYVRWMLESLGSVLGDHQLSRLEMQFKAECHWKDELQGEAIKVEDSVYQHQLKRQSDHKLLAIAKSFWK